MAIVQFESRAKVEDVLTAVEASSELQIDNERVQVKGSFDLLDLEWRAILPGDNEKPSPSTSRRAAESILEMKRKRESGGSSYESKRQKVLPWESNDDTLTASPHLPKNHDASIISESVDKLPASIEPCSPDSLRHQFWLIRQSTVIPDSEYNECLRIVDSLNKLFQENYSSNRIVMFRNWYLQLKHPTKAPNEEHLLIFAYNDWAPPDFPNSHSWLSENTIFKIFTGPKAQANFDFVSERSRSGYEVKYKSSAIPIRLFTYAGFMMEVQVCRLLKYLCLFDPRCHPLLTLVHYWMYINDAPFFVEEDPGKAHLSLPTPLNIQWLVIHFMCYRKYIPTVREIQGRSHQALIDRRTGIDVGFFADLEYVREWRSMKQESIDNEDYSSEKFVLMVVELFQEFLQFCGHTLDSGNYILNTRDGEIIDINQFLTLEPGYGWTTKMTREEFSELRALQKNCSASTSKNDNVGSDASEIQQKTYNQYSTDFASWKMYMIHPFKFCWRFSVSSNTDVQNVWAYMKETESKLKKYLKMKKCNGDAKAQQVCGDLQNVLTVDGNEIQEPLRSLSLQ